MCNLSQEDIHYFLTICHFSSPNTTPPQKNLISFYSVTHYKWCYCGYWKCSLMKLISRHNGRRFAEQNGPEGKERKSHILLILLDIFHFLLTRNSWLIRKKKRANTVSQINLQVVEFSSSGKHSFPIVYARIKLDCVAVFLQRQQKKKE